MRYKQFKRVWNTRKHVFYRELNMSITTFCLGCLIQSGTGVRVVEIGLGIVHITYVLFKQKR